MSARVNSDRDSAPSWSAIIRQAIEARLLELHTGLPARVVEYDDATQLARVQPLLQQAVWNQQGQLVATDLPEIDGVPVCFPSGGGWYIKHPLAAGDVVHLAFAERALDAWLDAAPGQSVDPKHNRKHDLSDAIAIASLRQRTAPLPETGDALVIGREDGSVEIRLTASGAVIKAPSVQLGSDAASAGVARGGDAVQVDVPAGTFLVSSPSPPGFVTSPQLTLTGSITSASTKVSSE